MLRDRVDAPCFELRYQVGEVRVFINDDEKGSFGEMEFGGYVGIVHRGGGGLGNESVDIRRVYGVGKNALPSQKGGTMDGRNGEERDVRLECLPCTSL